MIKYTEELIVSECNNKNLLFNEISNIFINNKKRRCVLFTCNMHKEGNPQIIAVEKLFSTKMPCKICNGSKRKETFKEEIANINPNIEILSEFKNVDIDVRCRCKIHDYEWMGRPSVLLRGGGCKICGTIKSANSQRLSLEDIREKLNNINDKIELIGKYKSYHSKIKCRCLVDGCEWESYVANLLNGSAKCPICSYENYREKRALTTNDFKSIMKEKYPDIIVLGEYVNANTPVRLFCDKHKYEFEKPPKYFAYRDRRGCPKCNLTNGEDKLYNILHDEYGLEPIYQYIFKDCKYINPLKFDIYVDSINTVFEYQGEQHYYPIPFTSNEDVVIKEFNKGKIRDDIKKKYCKENNIRLIEIPYWEYDDMYEYIGSQLKI